MNSSAKKFALTAHVVSSVAWLGAVIAYLALAIPALKSNDHEIVKSAFFAMNLVGWYAIVPLCFATILTGLVESLGTSWGLLRHYWVVAKLGLTALSTFILLKHMGGVTRAASGPIVFLFHLGMKRAEYVVHPAGGLIVLIVATVLAIYKPWGLTPYGRKKLGTGVSSAPKTGESNKVDRLT